MPGGAFASGWHNPEHSRAVTCLWAGCSTELGSDEEREQTAAGAGGRQKELQRRHTLWLESLNTGTFCWTIW